MSAKLSFTDHLGIFARVILSMIPTFALAGVILWQITGNSKGRDMDQWIAKSPAEVAKAEAPMVKALITGEQTPANYVRGDEHSLGKECATKIINQFKKSSWKGVVVTEGLVAEKLENCYRLSMNFKSQEF